MIDDINTSFRLFEFCLRVMTYCELGTLDEQAFGQDLYLRLEEGMVHFPEDVLQNSTEIIRYASLNVSCAFSVTALCLSRVFEEIKIDSSELRTAKQIVTAIRNAFAHGISDPRWFVKPHNFASVDLEFLGGPKVDLQVLNGEEFRYNQIGGYSVWIRIKELMVSTIRKLTS